MKTSEFTASYVGIGPEVPRQVRAFNGIRAEPDAAAAFADLLKRGQTPGRIFALAGLYLTDRAAFDREDSQFNDGDQYVRYNEGCQIHHVPAQRIENGIPAVAKDFAGMSKAAYNDL